MKIQKHKFWQIKNEASSIEAEILLYGEISSFAEAIHEYYPDDPARSAQEFNADLKALGGKDITLRINSPGGDVFQAQAMYSLLKAYDGKVRCHIDGICASAATLVACAADEIVIPANALYMIHNPAVGAFGMVDKASLEKLLSMLDSTKQSIVNVYTARCQGSSSQSEIEKMMDSETWMTADEALDKGFVDAVDDYGVAASIQNNGALVVNQVTMTGIDPTRNQRLLRLCMKKQKKELRIGVDEMSENKDDFMAKLKAFFDSRDAEAQKAAAETNRVTALDALKCDNEVVNALVEKAKETGATADEMKPYLEVVAQMKPQNTGLEELKKLVLDQMNSGASGIKATSQANDGVNEQAEIDAVVNFVNKRRG